MPGTAVNAKKAIADRMSDKSEFKQVVKRANGPRYSAAKFKPIPPPDPVNPPRRNPIHSILTALPVIMLVVGLYFYYKAENAQSAGAPIRAESVFLEGRFNGFSVVKSGISDQHFLWLDTGERVRGIRLEEDLVYQLSILAKGDPLQLDIAPTVSGSRTQWLWRLVRDGQLLMDGSDQLQ